MPEEKQPVPEWKDYPEPKFSDREARTVYGEAKEIIRQAWERMQGGEKVISLGAALEDHGLIALPPEICHLTSLRKLSLSGNRLRSLPVEIERLQALRQLDLSLNNFGEIPMGVFHLKALTYLGLYANRLSLIPPEIGRLKALTTLGLTVNSISSLPSEIGQLKKLKALYISSNTLTTLPSEIGQLDTLEQLVLSENELRALPSELKNLKTLKELYLHGNEGLGLDPSVLGPTAEEVWGKLGAKQSPARPQDILDYYFNVVLGGAWPLNEVRLLFLGRGGAGKTATVNRLLGKGFLPGTDETVGIEITDWRLPCPGGDPVLVHGWDFAGQKVPRAMHAYFLSHRSVYVLVLSGGREGTAQEDAEEWLKLMEAYAAAEVPVKDAEGKVTGTAKEFPPVIITLNKWESGTRPEVDRRSLEEKYPFIAGWVETDCKTGHGFDSGAVRLPQRLQELIGGMEWVRGPFPKAWHEAKEYFATMKESYLPYTSFQQIAEEKGVAAEEVRSFAGALHRLGLALNYGDDARLRDTTVLNPHWVTRTTYRILREAPRDTDAVMNLDHVAEVLPEEPPAMRAYAVELMRRFGMAFPLPERENHWLVPARLPETQPEGIAEAFGEKVAGATRLRFSLNPLPKAILPGFITRTHILSDDLPHWRWVNGVVLAHGKAQALVRADHADRIVTVTLTGAEEDRPVLASHCRRELASIFDEIPGLEPKEEMLVRPEVWQEVALMEELERERQTKLPVLVRGKVEMVEVKPLLDRIRPLAARDEEVWKPSVFISYSHKDERLKDELVMRLKVFQAAGLLGQVWTDRMLAPGEKWESSILRELDAADVVVLLISNEALESSFIRTKEMTAAFAREKAGTATVVPVILERCHWEMTAELKELQALPKDAKPVREWKPRNAGWFRVMEALQGTFAALQRARKR